MFVCLSVVVMAEQEDTIQVEKAGHTADGTHTRPLTDVLRDYAVRGEEAAAKRGNLLTPVVMYIYIYKYIDNSKEDMLKISSLTCMLSRSNHVRQHRIIAFTLAHAYTRNVCAQGSGGWNTSSLR